VCVGSGCVSAGGGVPERLAPLVLLCIIFACRRLVASRRSGLGCPSVVARSRDRYWPIGWEQLDARVGRAQHGSVKF
jgi:hypothetical protein